MKHEDRVSGTLRAGFPDVSLRNVPAFRHANYLEPVKDLRPRPPVGDPTDMTHPEESVPSLRTGSEKCGSRASIDQLSSRAVTCLG